MDSAVAAALAVDSGIKLHRAIFFWYGQRHEVEESRARALAHDWLNIPFERVELPGNLFASSQLLKSNPTVPRKNTPEDELSVGVAPTFIPGRNAVMLTLAMAIALREGVNVVVGGWHMEDSSGYPDCRPEFIRSMEATLRLALDRDDLEIKDLLNTVGKKKIVEMGVGMRVPFGNTWSCYDPAPYGSSFRACGECDTCQLRIKGFKEAGFVDPIRYAREDIDWGDAIPIVYND